MRWTTKARIQVVLSRIPAGERINWLLQRYVTHGYPRRGEQVDDLIASARRHVEVAEAVTGRDRSELRFLEFGAGWDLLGPLAMAGLGVRDQTLLDIRPLARQWLVVDAAEQLAARGLEPGVVGDGNLDATLRPAGIRYRAPTDARRTDLPAASIDVVSSTNTLEHIPREEIVAILAELRRLLSAGGVCSFAVDYHDHYADADASIGPLNYLQVSEGQWRRWNCGLHFQNRMRHSDYVTLFEDAGFVVEVTDVTRVAVPIDLVIDQRWSDRDAEDLGATYGWFVLRTQVDEAPPGEGP